MGAVSAANRVAAERGQEVDAEIGPTENRASHGSPLDRCLHRLERARECHRRIRREHDRDPGSSVMPDWVQGLGHLGADRSDDTVSELQVVLRLRDRDDAGSCHARNLVIRRQAGVLDRVPHVRPGRFALGSLDRVEHDRDRRGRLRVRAGLQPGAMGASHQRAELSGLVIEDAVVVGFGRIAFGKIGGQPAERAIGIQLDAAEREPVVSQATDQAELQRLFEEGRDDHHVHSYVETAGVARGDVGFRLAPAHLRIHDRCDPGPQELVQRAIELTAGNLRRLRQVNVGTVVANLDPVSAGEQVARGVPEKAIGRAVRIAADLTPRRGRRLRGDAVGLQAETIHAASMAADVHDIDLAIGCGTVEVTGEWLPALGKATIVIAEGA